MENKDTVFQKLEKKMRIIGDPKLVVELDRVCEFRSKEEFSSAIEWIQNVINKTKASK